MGLGSLTGTPGSPAVPLTGSPISQQQLQQLQQLQLLQQVLAGNPQLGAAAGINAQSLLLNSQFLLPGAQQLLAGAANAKAAEEKPEEKEEEEEEEKETKKVIHFTEQQDDADHGFVRGKVPDAQWERQVDKDVQKTQYQFKNLPSTIDFGFIKYIIIAMVSSLIIMVTAILVIDLFVISYMPTAASIVTS